MGTARKGKTNGAARDVSQEKAGEIILGPPQSLDEARKVQAEPNS